MKAQIKAQINKDETLITHDILVRNGFEKLYDVAPCYRKWTSDGRLKVDIDLIAQFNNSREAANVHIDNSDCDTVGHAELSTIEQYNSLMDVFRCTDYLKA